MMNRTRLKSKVSTVGGQKNILSFFSHQKQDMSTSSTRPALSSPQTSPCAPPTSPSAPPTSPTAPSTSPPAPPTSPTKRSVLGLLQNVLPPSPDLLSVPETPDSQIRRVSEPNADPPGLGAAGERSPLCRSPGSRGAGVRRGVGGENRGEASCIKRILSPSDEPPDAKRPRTSSRTPIMTTPTVGPLKKLRPVDHLLNDCLQATGQKVGSHGQGSKVDFSGANRTTLNQDRVEVASLKPLSVKGRASRQLGVRGSECVFTVINNQRPTDGGGAVTSSESDILTVTSSAQGQPGVTSPVTSLQSAAEQLDEAWFEDQMDVGSDPGREHKPKRSCQVPGHVLLCGGVNNRYWVLEVEETDITVKTITITCCPSLEPTETCVLTHGWETTPVSPGDVVHVEGRCDDGVWLVDRDQGFLVLLPDLLISGTSVSNAIRCMRRAVLADMFKVRDGSRQMLNGTLVHDVFQKAAGLRDFSLDTLGLLVDRSLSNPQHLRTMYSVGVSQDEMKQEVTEYLPSLSSWADQYLVSPAPKAISLQRGGPGSLPTVVTVTELVDIEESVWSPRFGLKGKIDVTARVRFPKQGSSRQTEDRILPLELKTGKESNSVEHRSQVILYCLMAAERHGDSQAGFLLYLKTGNLHPVMANRMDKRELVKLRNILVRHLSSTVKAEAGLNFLASLPDILTDRRTCQYCPQRINCALYERAVESSHPDYISHDAVQDFLDQETGHLTPPHLSYFSHWLLLCCLEAVTMETKSSRKHIWLHTAEEREKSGSCLGNLQLIGPVTVQSEGIFLHHFQRVGVASQQPSGLANGDRVVISDQEGRLVGLATGYMCDVSAISVSCTLDRNLSKYRSVVFRCDEDEGVNGVAFHLSNLSRLMEQSPESGHLRELLVDLRPPQFISSLSSVLPRDAKETVAKILKGLNQPQKQAMKKVLLSKDYTLILGMPGTGKTTTICTLVRILHACGFSVLLTSYTHSAVDNILLKLKRFRVGFLRLGRSQKVHPDIRPFTEEVLRCKERSLSDLEELYNREPLVATTCLGTGHALFSRRRFDFCIVDEASQISQPVCLGPLFLARRFVLVGDPQQLAPLVQNTQARSMGMDESLFKRLEVQSEAVVHLTVQYRMNRQIMSLSNCLMYGGRLECGSDRTATALLSLPFLSSVQSELIALSKDRPGIDYTWLLDALLPSNPVCFLDTSQVPAPETIQQGGVSNSTEAKLVHILLVLLIKAGCRPSDVGVISPYRQQLKLVSRLLCEGAGLEGVEVNTVDRYQGRDKNLIILTLVRSSLDGKLGDLLKDSRRLNVALTRSKHKLLVLGSVETLKRYRPLEALLTHLQQDHKLILLPPGAHQILPTMHF